MMTVLLLIIMMMMLTMIMMLYGHITSKMMTVLLLIIMMTMLTIHKTAHDDHGDIVWPYYMMNISEYIQICPVSFRIHIQTWPNIMITIGSGEDLVPEQENEVEEQQRARTAGSGEKIAPSPTACSLIY